MAICELNVSHLFITYILSTKTSHCKTFFKKNAGYLSIDKNSLLTHFIPLGNSKLVSLSQGDNKDGTKQCEIRTGLFR